MKVYIILVHIDDEHYYVDRVYNDRDEAEAYCDFFNSKGTAEGYADFTSKYVIGTDCD